MSISRPSRLVSCGLLITAAVLLPGSARCASDEAERPVVRVGLIVDGPMAGNIPTAVAPRDRLIEQVREEIRSLTGPEFDVRFPEDKRLDGGWDPERISAALDQLLADPQIDLVLAFGLFATAEATRRREFPKPTIAPFLIDIESQRVPFDGTGSGIHNLNFITVPLSLEDQIRRFQEIVGFERMHFVFDALISRVVPEVELQVLTLAERLGVEGVSVPISDSVDEALSRLPERADAVIVMPLVRLDRSEVERLIAGINARRIPSLSYLGTAAVREGLLMGLVEETNLDRLARRIALNVQRTLLGEDPAVLPVVLDQEDRLTINMATARTIGWYPSWDVLIEAELLGERTEDASLVWSLETVALEAVRANLAVLTAERELEVADEDVERARSALRLQADASLLGLVVDEDRAASSFGQQAERTVSGELAVRQLVYSDAARANVAIQRRLRAARQQEYDRLRLDVALDATVAFLDVLRAETLERIERQNMRLTENNLRIARRRQALGVTGPAEVYRWESQLANDRQRTIDAEQRVAIARAVLNRWLHRPIEQPFGTEIPNLLSPQLVTGQGRLQAYIDNPWSFELFREFMVRNALDQSPELRGLDEAIAAQQRAASTARRSFWSPEVALFGELTERLSRRGAGSEPATPFPGLDPHNETDWNVGLQLAIPLLTGGRRHSDLRRSGETLAALRLQRRASAENIELRVRVALFEIASSFTAIDLSAQSADAARRTLELVTDSYSRGVVSILDLLDAQRNAVVAEQVAANSVFDFLIDLMEVQRATVNFDFFRSDADRDAWFERLDGFFEEAGHPGGR